MITPKSPGTADLATLREQRDIECHIDDYILRALDNVSWPVVVPCIPGWDVANINTVVARYAATGWVVTLFPAPGMMVELDIYIPRVP